MKQKNYLQLAKKGDEKAFTMLYYQHYNFVYSFASRLTKGSDLTDDLVSLTFTKAFQYIHSYEPRFGFNTWLARIATNAFISEIRKNNAKKRANTTISLHAQSNDNFSMAEKLHDEDRDGLQILLHNEDLQDVREAIERIPTQYQTVLKLRYYDELSYLEIAEKTDTKMSTLKCNLFRAKQLVAIELQRIERKRA